jgi:hypothetical protein
LTQWLADHWAEIRHIAVNVFVSVVSALGALGATYRLFGEKLFGHFLDRRLQQLKHEHDIEIEQLKHNQNQVIENIRADIAHLSDRGKHSNEREYIALSAIWEKFVALYYATNVCVVSFVQYPDFNQMADDEIGEFLDSTELSKEQRAAVLKATDKGRSFSHITIRRYIAQAQSEFYEMSLLLNKLGIFIPKNIKDNFESVAKFCSSVIAQRYTEHGYGRTGLTHDQEFLAKGQPMLEALKDLVRERLLRE